MKVRTWFLLVVVSGLAVIAAGSVLMTLWTHYETYDPPRDLGGGLRSLGGTSYHSANPYAFPGAVLVVFGFALLAGAAIAAAVLLMRRRLSRAIEREVARQLARRSPVE